jgi:hypothetical protein
MHIDNPPFLDTLTPSQIISHYNFSIFIGFTMYSKNYVAREIKMINNLG